MKYTLTFQIPVSYDKSDDSYDTIDYDYDVELKIEDLIAYLLPPKPTDEFKRGFKNAITKLYDMVENSIDLYDMVDNDKDFQEFLREKYQYDANESYDEYMEQEKEYRYEINRPL